MDIWCSFSLKVTVLVFWNLIQPFSFFSIRSLEDYLVHFALFSNFMDLSPMVVIQCHFYNDLIISILFFCLEPSLKSWKAKLVRRYHVLKPIAYLFGFYLIFITNSRIIEICLHFSNFTPLMWLWNPYKHNSILHNARREYAIYSYWSESNTSPFSWRLQIFHETSDRDASKFVNWSFQKHGNGTTERLKRPSIQPIWYLCNKNEMNLLIYNPISFFPI